MNTNVLQKNLFQELGLENIPDEDKMELLSKATELIMKQTMYRVGERLEQLNLPEAEQKKILDPSKTEEERFILIQTYVPELQTIMQEEIAQVRQELSALKNK